LHAPNIRYFIEGRSAQCMSGINRSVVRKRLLAPGPKRHNKELADTVVKNAKGKHLSLHLCKPSHHLDRDGQTI